MAGCDDDFMETAAFLRKKVALVVGQINQLCDNVLLKACVYLKQRQIEQPVPDDLQYTFYVCGKIMTAIAEQAGFTLDCGPGNACYNFVQCENFVLVLEKEQMEMVNYFTSIVNQDIISVRKMMASGCKTLENFLSGLEKRINMLDDIMWILTRDRFDVHRECSLLEENPSDSGEDLQGEDHASADSGEDLQGEDPASADGGEDLPQLSDMSEDDYASAESAILFATSNLKEENPKERDERHTPKQSNPEILQFSSQDAVTQDTLSQDKVIQPPVIHHQPTQTTWCLVIGTAMISIGIAVAWHNMQNIGTTQSATIVPPSLYMPEKTRGRIPAKRETENLVKPFASSPESLVLKSFSCHFHPGSSAMSSSEAEPIVPSAGQWEIEESAGWTEVEGNLYPPDPGLYRIGLTFKQVGDGGIEILILRVDPDGLPLNQYAVMAGKTFEDKGLVIEVKKIRFEINMGLSVWGWKRNHTAIESFKINGKWVGD